MKKVLGFLVGTIIMGMGILGVVDVSAMTVENPSVIAKNPRRAEYTERLLITELGISDVNGGAYFVYELNDAGFFSGEGLFGLDPSVETISLFTEDLDGKQIALGSTTGVLPTSEEGIRIETGGDDLWVRSDFDLGEILTGGDVVQLLMRTKWVETVDAGGRAPGWSDTVLDMADCIELFEEGVTCKVEREEVREIIQRDESGFGDGVGWTKTERVLYYAAYDENGKLVHSEESDGSGDGGMGGGEDGVSGSVVEKIEDEDGDGEREITGDEEEKGVVKKTDSDKREARSFAVVENNETDESAEDIGEVLGEQVAVAYDEEEMEVPPAGRPEVGIRGAWMFWLVGAIVVAWVIVAFFKRRKERENEKAVANIVAETKK